MILTPANEYSVVLDASVLVPMPLCDLLLRLAEEPAFYRPLWSDQILQEVGNTLEELGYSEFQRARRLKFMHDHFPEALLGVPAELASAVLSIPDEGDRHVVAAAIRGKADAIPTLNLRDFPQECLNQHGITVASPDEFLIDQFHLNPEGMLDKIDAQATAIGNDRSQITARLRNWLQAPKFADLIDSRTN